MNEIFLLEFYKLTNFLLPSITLSITVLIGFILRKIIFIRLNHWAQKTSTQIDDILISSTHGPFMIWSIMLGIFFALEVSKLPNNLVQISSKTLFILGVISITLVLTNISSKLIKYYSSKMESTLPVSSFTQNITRILIFLIGILVILNSLGISITPILATLGVGGLAVALALQDTLSNLFSGFNLIMTKQIKVGDFIKLESGDEGYIVDINWRITKIKKLPNNIVMIPNEKLAKSIITNYSLPDKELAVLVNLNVHYDSDLNKVEKITSEVAKEVMKETQGGIPDFEPFIRYNNFGESGINFSVILRAKEFTDQYLVKHDFIKKVQERYKKENIVIPYPIRTINYANEPKKN